jgi:hypothetical protein
MSKKTYTVEDEQAERIKENLDAAMENNFQDMSFSEMEDIFEDRDIAEFL